MGIASTPSLGLSTNANGGLVGPVPFWDEGRNVPSPQPGSVVTGADGAKYILAKATGVIPPNTNVVLTEPAMTVAAGAGDWYSQTTAIPINNYAWFRASIQGGGGQSGVTGKIANPFIGVVGASLEAQNTYGATGPLRSGVTVSGPLSVALYRKRYGQFIINPSATAPNFDGFNQAREGAGMGDLAAQIVALISKFDAAGIPKEKRIFVVGISRNDYGAGTGTITAYQASIDAVISQINASGYGKIIFLNVWKKNTSLGGDWASGGSFRLLTDQINAYLATKQSPSIVVADIQSSIADPGSSDGNPYSDVTRDTGLTHYAPNGAFRAAIPIESALDAHAVSRAFPAPGAADDIFPVPSGVGGTKTNVTGTVFDGYSIVGTTGGGTLEADATVTYDGLPFQRIKISNTAAISANGYVITLTTPVFTLPEGVKKGVRFRLKKNASGLIGFLPIINFQGGDANAQARSNLGIGLNNGAGTGLISVPGTAFAATGKIVRNLEDDWWLESPSYVIGAAGGSSVNMTIAFVYGPGASGDVLQFDIGKPQTFDWPI